MSQLARKIVAEIQKQGPIPFARFMELALYCPVYGYYEKEGDSIGRRGDYYTSVSVGRLFGRLLAFQFADWLDQCAAVPRRPGAEPGDQALHIVEGGAHLGELAGDILGWLQQHRPALFRRLRYWIVEPSKRRKQWQQGKLSAFADQVCWAESLPGLAAELPGGVRGIVFSNELLDAFPAHRFGWDAARCQWFEWGVGLEGEKFVWARTPGGDPLLENPQGAAAGSESADRAPGGAIFVRGIASELGDVLPDGFSFETSVAAIQWWKQAAQLLQAGKLLTVDYGLTAEERFRPERSSGTLRAYRGHHVDRSVLEDPGEHDITAHIDFTGLCQAGEECGLVTEALVSQAQFLTPVAARMWNGEPDVGEWHSADQRQFQTLTHPEHLGRAFRVLLQSRPQTQC